jgi:hypothetical protein
MAIQLNHDLNSYLTWGTMRSAIQQDVDAAKCGGYLSEMTSSLAEIGHASINYNTNNEPISFVFSTGTPVDNKAANLDLTTGTVTGYKGKGPRY